MAHTLPLQIGITGGIGCGKSIVSRVFAVLGIPVYDADSRAKWLMSHDSVLKEQIRALFGAEAYLADGNLNRTYIAARVFADEDQVQRLNVLVHPRVGDDYRRWRQQQTHAPYTLREAALLYEAKAYHDLHAIIVVTAPLELRLQRISQRDPHRSRADTMAIMDKQMPEEEKVRRADHLIRNDETQLIIPQVLALHTDFIRQASAGRF